MAAMPSRSVLAVVFPEIQALDLAGPIEVFDMANRLSGRNEYAITVAGAQSGRVRTSSGLGVAIDTALSDISRAPDTLIVTGGAGTASALADTELVRQVSRLAKGARRVTSVCSGAFLLAEAGLLDGRRATTHWAWCETFATRYPAIKVDPAPIYVREGNIYTSAGVTAGMDLALALVEEDLGRDLALAVARQLVMFLHRPANQTQFSAQLVAQLAERDAIREAQRLITENPGANLTVPALAAHVGMSERNFARYFRQEVGQPPGHYVASVRIEAARRLLEDTDRAVAEIAAACGFGTVETMRRSFLRTLGCGPTDFRRRFRSGAA
jgi:transcriptional regulator GlxA family with amidase domain